jgi:hypothetical protein
MVQYIQIVEISFFISFQIAKRPISLKMTDVFNGFNWDKIIEHQKSSVRCKVESEEFPLFYA